MPTPTFICPQCEERIEYLNYNVTATETGIFTPNATRPTIQALGEWQSEESNWENNPMFCCPECGDEINLTDLELTNQEEKTEIKIINKLIGE